MTMIPNEHTTEGRELGDQLARFVEVELSAHPDKPDGRCDSCAFRRGTDPNGCPNTLMDAVKCLLEGDRFDCHEDASEGRAIPCRGWAILEGSGGGPATRRRLAMPWPYSDETEDR